MTAPNPDLCHSQDARMIVAAINALTEQQRAANLIAYASAVYPNGSGVRRMGFMAGTTPEDDVRLRDEIERLIGPEPSHSERSEP